MRNFITKSYLVLLEVPRESVRKIARELNRPFKYQPVQKLGPGDAERRLTYCRWGLERLQEDPDFFRNVCFTDEALFTNLELVNKQNCRWWAPENPHWIVEQDNQHRWKLHVWVGVLQDRILGPIFLDGNLTSAKYTTVLTEELPSLMDGNPIRMDQVWWQQDGAPAHNSNANKAILDAMFPECWIGTRGPVRWPARSPDLTVCDFWFWSRVKEIVYERAPTTKHDMRHRIAEACAAIPVREMQRVRGSIRKRLALTVQQNGGHIEHLLRQRNQE
ncbi:uncharacterized protein LOC124182188 [Neodiprion fabricii]|uniref:uncharacterized protein LOC124182179 n=1 Tax=Neodiprion fabricii TaxID=2872261 RepID=UPI001ED92543|nr:uncharacterized protein LOC124182179 [Neodiprion fabricii]XP_046425081.1 uncharacterized protein LOC124182188 [Neodiprion fabricii]